MASEVVSEIVSTLTRYAEANIKRRNQDEEFSDDAVLNKIQDQVLYYCKAESKRDMVDKTFKECIEKISNSATPGEAALVCKLFEDSCNAALDCQDVNSDKRYKKFLALRSQSLDETICVVKSTQNFTDPLSKKRMVDPVKNTQCGHSYEKSAALEVLKRNPRTRCPMLGCSAFIEKKLLVTDEDLKRQLATSSQEPEDDNDSRLVSLDDTE